MGNLPPWLLVFGMLALGACSNPAEVSSPISEPGLAPYDQRLLGKWHQLDNDDGLEFYTGIAALTIRPHPNGFLIVDYSFMGAGEGESENECGTFFWARRTAYASIIDGATYYNSRPVDFLMVGKNVGEPVLLGPGDFEDTPDLPFAGLFAPHEKRGYWIVKPEIVEGESLTLRYLSVGDLTTLGYRGREVDCGPECSFTTIDLSSDDLIALIRRANPEDLFDADLGTFVRNDVCACPAPAE